MSCVKAHWTRLCWEWSCGTAAEENKAEGGSRGAEGRNSRQVLEGAEAAVAEEAREGEQERVSDLDRQLQMRLGALKPSPRSLSPQLTVAGTARGVAHRGGRECEDGSFGFEQRHLRSLEWRIVSEPEGWIRSTCFAFSQRQLEPRG